MTDNSSSNEASVHDDKIRAVVSISEKEIGDPNAQITSILSPTDNKEVVLTGDVDDAMKLALEARDLEVTPEQDWKLVKKIDLFMFPLLSLQYAMQFLDKTSTGLAAIMGLREDLKMHGEQYANSATLFYYAYMLGLFVLPPLLQKTKHLSPALCLIIIIWGLIQTVQGTPNINYAGFCVLRFLLGFFESAITPAFTVITCQYYKKSEQFLRMCMWFGCNGFGSILGNAISVGLIKHIDDGGSYTISPWKLLFIITGLMSMFLAFVMIFHVPSDPSRAWFLSKKEKLMVVKRIQVNQQGFGNHHWKWNQFKEALRDWRTWAYFLYSVSSNIPNGALTNFQSILIKGEFGFTTLKTLKMNMIGGAVEFIGVPLFALIHTMLHNRGYKFFGDRLVMACFVNIVVAVSACMLAFPEDKYAKLAGVYMSYVSPVAFVCVLSNIGSNTLGSTKKWTVTSMYLLAYCASNIAGTHTFIAKQAPQYQGGKISMVVCYFAGCVILMAIWLGNVRENRRRDKWAEEHPQEGANVENLAFHDLTDFENPQFRYAL
ncbi:hypothetical protein ACO0QE_001860 [Hanseniaspora vineae]